jgi:hypothetical protein
MRPKKPSSPDARILLERDRAAKRRIKRWNNRRDNEKGKHKRQEYGS